MIIRFSNSVLLGMTALSHCLLMTPASASEPSASKQSTPQSVVIAPANDFCETIKKPAEEARYALQLKTLEELQKKIDEKTALLEEKYQRNLAFEKQQKEKVKTAQQAVVDIYSKMKPDIAAGQLELLDPEIAVAILDQLKTRVSSSILNEMKGQSAAIITAMMAGEAKVQQP